MMEREELVFTRAPHDTNGNPRYVVHFLNLNTQKELDETPNDLNRIRTLYALAVSRANAIGGRKYNVKRYGGGIVFQSYSIDETAAHISRLTGRNFKAIGG